MKYFWQRLKTPFSQSLSLSLSLSLNCNKYNFDTNLYKKKCVKRFLKYFKTGIISCCIVFGISNLSLRVLFLQCLLCYLPNVGYSALYRKTGQLKNYELAGKLSSLANMQTAYTQQIKSLEYRFI